MLFAILSYLRDHSGAPITEIRRHFELPSDMAASWIVQLEDAGWVVSPPLTGCHHLEEGSGCESCSSGGCGSKGACATGDAFERGCCGMNGPYVLTDKGRAFLERRAS